MGLGSQMCNPLPSLANGAYRVIHLFTLAQEFLSKFFTLGKALWHALWLGLTQAWWASHQDHHGGVGGLGQSDGYGVRLLKPPNTTQAIRAWEVDVDKRKLIQAKGTTRGCVQDCGIRGAISLKPSLDNQGLSRDNTGYCLAKTLETIRGCVMTTLGVTALKPLVSNLTLLDNAT